MTAGCAELAIPKPFGLEAATHSPRGRELYEDKSGNTKEIEKQQKSKKNREKNQDYSASNSGHFVVFWAE